MHPVKQFTKLQELYEEKKHQTLDKITKEEIKLLGKYQRIVQILEEK